jgi:hypothetical protein
MTFLTEMFYNVTVEFLAGVETSLIIIDIIAMRVQLISLFIGTALSLSL